MLDQIHPMRSDVAHGAQRTVLLRIHAPIPIGIVEQPILRIGALHDQDFAQIARFDHAPDLLDNRVVAQIVLNAIGEPGVGRKIDQFARLFHAKP